MPAEQADADEAPSPRGKRFASGWNRFRSRPRWNEREGWRAWLAAEWEREAAFRTFFHLIPVAMGAGAIAAYGFDASISVGLGAGLAGLAFALSARMAGRTFAPVAALVLLAFAGGVAASHVELGRTGTTMFSGEATVHVTGRVVSHEADSRGRSRYVVDIDETVRPVLSRPPERVRIVVAAGHEPLAPGDAYSGLVRLRPPAGPAFPGGYDFAYAPYFDGLGAYGFSLGRPEPVPNGGDGASLAMGDRLSRWIATLRGGITDRLRSTIEGQPGAVAAALVTGERAGIDDETKTILRSTGLAHILAISGLHVALVAGFAMISIRRILALCGSTALIWPTKKIAAVGAILVASAYLVLSGASVATERAYVMLLVMLLAVLCDRPAVTMRNISIAAILILAVSPHEILTASFQMSFAATIGLVGVYGAWSRYRRSRAPRERASGIWSGFAIFVLGMAATATIAGLATAPYAIYHFQRFAPFGIVANVLVMPIFTFVVMPAGLIGTLAMPFGLDGLPLWVMGKGLAILVAIAAELHGILPDPPIGLVRPIALVLMTIALLVFCVPVGRLRWAAVPIAIAGLVLAAIRPAPPELLIFEDGKTFATIEGGRLAYSKSRPNGFVSDQWERAYGNGEKGLIGGLEDCEAKVCLFETSSAMRIAYTEDYRLLGQACDLADVAIVARAARIRECRSGAVLVTLRTLRRTGSLAISNAGDGVAVRRSIPASPQPWNVHRHAPWPEYWRNPDKVDANAADD